MNEIEEGTCLSCLGTGEVSSERGLARCEDCDGSGKIGSVFIRNEQRVREIERRCQKLSGEAKDDAQWLVLELRQTRGALVKIMTAAQDGPEDNELLQRILFEAIDALGMYARTSQDS